MAFKDVKKKASRGDEAEAVHSMAEDRAEGEAPSGKGGGMKNHATGCDCVMCKGK